MTKPTKHTVYQFNTHQAARPHQARQGHLPGRQASPGPPGPLTRLPGWRLTASSQSPARGIAANTYRPLCGPHGASIGHPANPRSWRGLTVGCTYILFPYIQLTPHPQGGVTQGGSRGRSPINGVPRGGSSWAGRDRLGQLSTRAIGGASPGKGMQAGGRGTVRQHDVSWCSRKKRPVRRPGSTVFNQSVPHDLLSSSHHVPAYRGRSMDERPSQGCWRRAHRAMQSLPSMPQADHLGLDEPPHP